MMCQLSYNRQPSWYTPIIQTRRPHSLSDQLAGRAGGARHGACKPQSSETGKVNIGLVLHWTYVTNFSGLFTYGLKDEHITYTPQDATQNAKSRKGFRNSKHQNAEYR